MEGYGHTVELRVRFAETDAQGIAHNAAYLVWFEVGRVVRDPLGVRLGEADAELDGVAVALHAPSIDA